MYQNVCDQEKNLKNQFNNLLQNKTRRLYNEYNLNSNINWNTNSKQQNQYILTENSFLKNNKENKNKSKPNVSQKKFLIKSK